jgi:hypothetical protein
LNSNDPHFERWGKRGITICDEWKDDFQSFYDWSMSHGYSDDLTIDRINNDGNYEPSNCRWVSVAEQARNKRTSVIISYKGKTQTAAQWAKELRTGHDTIRQRFHKGWTTEECLFGKKVMS